MLVVTWFTALVLAAPGTPRPVGLEVDLVTEDDPFQWSVSVPQLGVGEEATASIRLALPPGFLVFRDSLSVKASGEGSLRFGKADLPDGVKVTGPKGRSREVYDMDVVVTLPVIATEAGLARGSLSVTWQACHQGLCLPARTESVEVFAPAQ